jgi:hypothetical protein
MRIRRPVKAVMLAATLCRHSPSGRMHTVRTWIHLACDWWWWRGAYSSMRAGWGSAPGRQPVSRKCHRKLRVHANLV